MQRQDPKEQKKISAFSSALCAFITLSIWEIDQSKEALWIKDIVLCFCPPPSEAFVEPYKQSRRVSALNKVMGLCIV